MQLRLTCVLKAQCTRAFKRCSFNNTPTPCRDVSQRVIRGDRRRCGVSESSPSSLSLPTRSVVVLMTIPARARTTQGADLHMRVRANAPCKHKSTEREISTAIQSSAVCRTLSSRYGAPPTQAQAPVHRATAVPWRLNDMRRQREY